MFSKVQKYESDSRFQSLQDTLIQPPPAESASEELHQRVEYSPTRARSGHRTCPPILPLVTFVTILSALVYLFCRFLDGAGVSDVQSPGTKISSSTRYVADVMEIFDFITAWSGAISLISTVSVTILFLYFVGRFKPRHNGRGEEILQCKAQQAQRLIALPEITGSLPDWLLDVSGQQKESGATHRPFSKAARLIGIMITLSLLIQAAEIWLHLGRIKNSHDVVGPQTSVHSLGRGISEATRQWLANPLNTDQGTGTLVPRYNNKITDIALQVWLRNSSTAYQTLEGRSPDHAIETLQTGNQTFAYLVEKTTPSNLDYNASTVGASTSCLPLKMRCANIARDPCPTFPFNFRGVLPNTPMALRLFNNSAPTFNNKSSYTSPTNPFSWGFYTNIDGWDYPDNLWSNNPFIWDMNVIISSATLPSLIMMMYCHTTVYDITYSVVNSTIDYFQTSIGNDTLSGLVGSPMFPVSSRKPASDRDLVPPSEMDIWPGFDSEVLNLGLRAATSGKTSYDIADSWSTTFSRAAVASAAGVMERRRNLAESSRETMLTREWALVPLYTLVCLDLLYAMSLVMLTVLAAVAWRSSS